MWIAAEDHGKLMDRTVGDPWTGLWQRIVGGTEQRDGSPTWHTEWFLKTIWRTQDGVCGGSMIQSIHGEVTDRNETHQTVTIKRDGAYRKDWRVAGMCRPGQTQA